jgi:hypothetical protein
MAKILGMDGKPSQQTVAANPPKISLSDSKPIVCQHEYHGEICGGEVFMPAVKFRTISKLLTGTPEDALVPIEVYCCSDCGTVCDAVLPKEVKNLK